MSKRFDVLREIERLDAERDHQRIVHLSFGYEFPWDSIRALEIALYRTYCVPTISALLDRTGKFRERTQQRYDDTSLIIAEMCKWGYESGRGRDCALLPGSHDLVSRRADPEHQVDRVERHLLDVRARAAG